MNCKQGDLAVLIKADNASSIGRIVRCIQPLPDHLLRSPRGLWRADSWRVENAPPGYDGTGEAVVPDAWLRPIRDNDGEDETLIWAFHAASDIKTPEAA